MTDQQPNRSQDEASNPAVPDGAAPTTSGRFGRLARRLLPIPTPVIFVVGLALAAALIWKQGRSSEIVADLRRIDPLFIVGVLALYAIGPALQCVRWDALARMVGAPSRLQKSAELFLTSVIV